MVDIKSKILVLFVLISLSGGTVISNLNVIFETFAPLSMVRFFEFNDVGWTISEKCIKDMFLYLDGLHKDVLWAVKRTYFFGCFLFFPWPCNEANYFLIEKPKFNCENQNEIG